MRDQYRLMVTAIINGISYTNQISDIQTSSIQEIRRLVKIYQKEFEHGHVFAERMTYDKFGNLETISLLEDPWEELKYGSFGRAN